MAALYLKYRPQSLDQLIGQEVVKKTLLSAISTGKLSHAYLFVGPRGTGKTSAARILAKMVNCEVAITQNIPCNMCSTCISITDGSNLDLIEVDAASNRGIDDIRSLRENIKLSPTASKMKVYIIDEVHMLTTEAFNALLKTLEEPPSHALFILATTEVGKVPATILSRVQRLDFKLASQSDLVSALRVIADGEKIKVDDEVLKLLAKKADGSFRDGVKYLDQLSSSGDITKESIEELLQSGDFNEIVNLVDNLVNKDTSSALAYVVRQVERGVSIKNLIQDVMDILRSLVFIKHGLGMQLVSAEYGSDKYQKLQSLSEKFSNGDLVKAIEILIKAQDKLKISSIQSLPMELAVVEICSVGQLGEPDRIGSSESVDQKSQNQTSIHTDTLIVNETPINSEKIPEAIQTSEVGIDTPDMSKIKEKWTYVLETIRQNNFSLEALLRSVKIASCNGGILLLEVPYAFHQRILEQPKSRNLLENIISDILEKQIRVSTALVQRVPRVEDVANIEMAADDEIISLASDIFNGKLVD